MFSSLASFIFGSNTSATTNSEENNHQPFEREHVQLNENENLVRIDAENTINVTSSTPSVAGSSSSLSLNDNHFKKSGKSNKRNKNNRNNRRQAAPKPSLKKLLTPTESSEEDLDEDDWYIVGKEDEELSLPRTDSEEELSVVEVKCNNNSVTQITTASQRRRQQQHQHQQQQHINSHSLYSGPRPQQQRNLLQRARNNGARCNIVASNVLTLNPPRNVIANNASSSSAGIVGGSADTERNSQSLFITTSTPTTLAAVAAAASNSNSPNSSGSEFGANISMDESWFVTPPPCFTSIGPINMETSPYENLLIEHPSMSVYHSIRSAQEAAESFINLDLGVGESHQGRRPIVAATVSVAATSEAPVAIRTPQEAAATQQPRTANARADRFSAAQIKQELFARSNQKSHDKKERQNLCRGAIKRANKARDFQSRGNRQRRSDMQHCKLLSGANNNRKCCF